MLSWPSCKGKLQSHSNVFQFLSWTIRDMCSKLEEKKIFASPNTVCTGCPVLEQKIVFYQKKISWLRGSKSKLEDSINADSTSSNAEAITLHVQL